MAGVEGTRATRLNRRLVPIVLVGAALFVACNGWMALRSVEWLERSEGWVDHTWQVIARVERMMSSAKDAETGSRGYLLTGDAEFSGAVPVGAEGASGGSRRV